jgi:hypothetical protein
MENNNNTTSKPLFLGACVLIGLFLLGYFIYKGLKTFSDKDRVVTVKGLAEMNMTATVASINISFSYAGDDLKELIQLTKEKKIAIEEYLKTQGYKKEDIEVKNINISDKQKYYETEWQNGQEVQVKIDRYTISQNLIVSSKDVKTTEDKSAKINVDLVSRDLTATLTTNYYFPELNTIKPKLIAASTKNARIAGEQFAKDSDASLGKIKTASQGQITIAGEYYYGEEGAEGNSKPEEPYLQKCRVVSTIVFFLE